MDSLAAHVAWRRKRSARSLIRAWNAVASTRRSAERLIGRSGSSGAVGARRSHENNEPCSPRTSDWSSRSRVLWLDGDRRDYALRGMTVDGAIDLILAGLERRLPIAGFPRALREKPS